MYSFLTELVKLVREQPGTFPVLFGAGLVLVNAPGTPLFLGLEPTLCALLTDIGLTVVAVGMAAMILKHHVKERNEALGHLQSDVAMLKVVLCPEGSRNLEVRLDDVEVVQDRLLDMSSVPYYESDAKGRIVYVNKAYTALYGVPHATLLNDQPLTFIHPRERARVFADATLSVQNKGGYTIKARITVNGRDRCKVVFRGSPVFDSQGVFTGHHGVVEILEDYRVSN